MKKGYFLLLLFALAIDALGQTGSISGLVKDKNSSQPLGNVHVFLPGTTYQSFSDSLGRFVIFDIPIGKWKLVASKEGFLMSESEILIKNQFDLGDETKIFLNPGMLVPEPATLNRSQKEKALREFNDMLIEGIKNEDELVIVNPEVLNYYVENKNISISSKDVLLIQNLESGYILSVWFKKPILIGDNNQLENLAIGYLEMESPSPDEMKVIQERRISLYEKSPAFQLRKAISDNPNQFSLTPSDVKGEYRLNFTEKENAQIGSLKFTGSEDILIRSNGTLVYPKNIYDTNSKTKSNPTAALPIDFFYEKALALTQIERTPENLQERVFIHTDRDIYLMGEDLHFKAYMVYGNPEMISESSKVLHVEIQDTIGSAKIHKIFPIINGLSEGKITLGPELDSKNFVVKAYTLWAANYGVDFEFVKPIQVLTSNWVVDEKSIRSIENGISVFSDKEFYQAQDSVKLNLMVKDPEGKISAGNLSVSVLKADAYSPNDPNSFVDFARNKPEVEIKDLEDFRLEKEYGFTLEGFIRDSTIYMDKSRIEVFVDGFLDKRELSPDLFGKFYLKGLEKEGEFALAVKAENYAGDPLSPIEMAYLASPNKIDYSKLHFPIAKTTSGSLGKVDSLRSAYLAMQAGEILLETVEVKEKKKPTYGTVPYGRPQTVITMDNKFYVSGDTRQFMYSLAARIPGFITGGEPPMILNKRGPSAGPPAILVNGSPITNYRGTTFSAGENDQYRALNSINIFNVERIEIIRSIVVALGDEGAFGVINFVLKDGSELMGNSVDTFKGINLMGFEEKEVPTNSLISMEGPTLYWNPNLKVSSSQTSTSLSFKLPEDSGPFWVIVNGLNASGEPISGRFLMNANKLAFED